MRTEVFRFHRVAIVAREAGIAGIGHVFRRKAQKRHNFRFNFARKAGSKEYFKFFIFYMWLPVKSFHPDFCIKTI